MDSSSGVKTLRFDLDWLYLAMVVFLHHSLVEGIVWSLLGLPLQGENPKSNPWVDLAMAALVCRSLFEGVIVEALFQCPDVVIDGG